MELERLIDNFRDKFYLPNIVEKLAAYNLSTNELVKIVRPITKTEISKLESLGNHCSDWSKVFVEPEFTAEFIRNNNFSGRIFLGNYSGEKIRVYNNFSHHNGIYNSNLHEVYIDSECLIKDNGLINRYYISENSVIVGNDLISADKINNFGNGTIISVGSEVGGRDIPLYAEQDINYISELITGKKEESTYNKYHELVKAYSESVSSHFGIISQNARVINNRKIINTFIGTSAEIDNTIKIENCTILSDKKEISRIKDGVIMENSLCQWATNVESMALVQNSLLSEYSGVERHGKVRNSIIGPNTIIGEGEVTASILGPFVGFHHQSMLIGSLWTGGRGNVGYGANIGSNHTSKLPDQELFCGEGQFFGLGSNVKFPADYRLAPYSIIATGVTTLPQKIEFPFSLISQPFATQKDVPPAYNEILPGWVLSDNSYAIFRNQTKYQERNKSKRLLFDYRVFRADIMKLVLRAYTLLVDAKKQKIYTDLDIPGLGKNFLTHENLVKAVETYQLFMRYYVFKELFAGNESTLITEIVGILEIELPKLDVKTGYQNIFKKIISLTINSKLKDQIRGAKIIDDYDEWHPDIEDDAVIAALKTELDEI